MFLFLTSSHLNWSMVRISRSFWLCFLDLSNTCLILYSSFSATASFSFPLSLFINFPYLCTWQIQKFNCQNYFRPIYYEGFLKDNGLFVFHSLWITLLISNLLIKDFFSFWMICYTVFQFLLKALDYILQFLNENLCEDLISNTKLIFFTTKVETFIAFERFKKLPNFFFTKCLFSDWANISSRSSSMFLMSALIIWFSLSRSAFSCLIASRLLSTPARKSWFSLASREWSVSVFRNWDSEKCIRMLICLDLTWK